MDRTRLSDGRATHRFTHAEVVDALRLSPGEIVDVDLNSSSLTLTTKAVVTVTEEKIVDVKTGVESDRPAPAPPVSTPAPPVPTPVP